MIAESVIQQITDQIDIFDIIGGFVNLKKRGVNYLGVCPFHNEKTPSFTVSPVKSIYKCFGCGRSGNAITFLMEHEKMSYVEVIRWLGERYDIPIEETGTPQPYNESTSLFIINRFAADYFHSRRTDAASYFEYRQLASATIEKFELGYDDGGLAALAKEKQYNGELIRRAGLITERDTDAYRGRVIFPIHNTQGKVMGFGARKQADEDYGPKYINTPENDAYNKSKALYGLYQAGREISRLDECVLVEGYTDVLSLHQGGIGNTVASCGTSLTIGHLRLIQKYTTHLTIIYDGDEAGKKAALRGLDLALTEGLRVKGVILPAGEDPDSYISSVGPEKFKAYIESQKKDIIVIQLQLLLQGSDDSVKRSEAVNTIAASIAKLNRPEDFSLRSDYIRRCSQMLGVEEQGLLQLVNQLSGIVPPPEPVRITESEDNLAEKSLLKALLEHGSKDMNGDQTVSQFIMQQIQDNDLLELMDNAGYAKIVTEYNEHLQQGVLPESNVFLYHSNAEISAATVAILDTTEAISTKWQHYYKGALEQGTVYQREVTSSLTYVKLRKVKKLIRQNQQDLKNETDLELQELYLRTHQHLKEIEIELTKELGSVIVTLK